MGDSPRVCVYENGYINCQIVFVYAGGGNTRNLEVGVYARGYPTYPRLARQGGVCAPAPAVSKPISTSFSNN